MGKLYFTTEKGKTTAIGLGSTHNISRKSPRWITYHIGNGSNHDVYEVDIKEQTVKKFSGKTFSLMNRSSKDMLYMIKKEIGLDIDFNTMVTLYDNNAFTESINNRIREFLIKLK